MAFVVIGRASHGESASPLGFLETLWPFAAGLLVGWWALGRRDLAVTRIPAGVVTGAYAAVVGLALRGLTGQGVAWSFAVVAVVVLTVFTTGWRAVRAAVLRARSGRS